MSTLTQAKEVRRNPIISSPVFGTWLFVFVELMFFMALFSSYFVLRRGRPSWDAAVELPVAATGFNTLILLLSGAAVALAYRQMNLNNKLNEARAWLLRGFILGTCFLAFQLFLMSKMYVAGLSMTSNIFGACYHLIVGSHAAHAFAGLIAMFALYRNLNRNLEKGVLKAFLIFWLLIVLVWPMFYAQIFF